MILSTLLIAFVTGLTTGGLSCFAVQGGLLTSSIAATAEKNQPAAPAAPARPHQKRRAAGKNTRGKTQAAPEGLIPAAEARPGIARPMLLFLAAKLGAYTLLGLLLGWAGTQLFLTPLARGIVQVAVGIFMIGNGLRMLNVHPIFRVFAFEPPRAVTRWIRRSAKNGSSASTPLWLGLLTVLIPCGVTQVMMAAAVSSGSPWMGAGILFAFVLGASPTFFGVTYLAARLSALFERRFFQILGTAIFLLGIYSFDTGLNLAGSPVSLTRAVSAARLEQIFATPAPAVTGSLPSSGQGLEPDQVVTTLQEGLSRPQTGAFDMNGSTDLTINVYNTAYEPDLVYAPADQPIRLTLVTDGVYSCSLAFAIPALDLLEVLENTGERVIEIPPQPAGTVMPFMCSMGMFTGQMIFE